VSRFEINLSLVLLESQPSLDGEDAAPEVNPASRQRQRRISVKAQVQTSDVVNSTFYKLAIHAAA
jgi:hypothetical protein